MPHHEKLSHEESPKRSRSITRQFRGLFRPNSPASPPSSSTTAVSGCNVSGGHKVPLPGHGSGKSTLGGRHEVHCGNSNISEESVISVENIGALKAGSMESAFYDKGQDSLFNSSQPGMDSPAMRGDGLRRPYGSGGALLSTRSDDFTNKTTNHEAEPLGEYVCSKDRVLSHSNTQVHSGRSNFASQRSRSASLGKIPENGGASNKGESPKRQKYVVKQEHFMVDEEGNHQHCLKILSLVDQDVESSHRSKSTIFSGVFKLHKSEDEGDLSLALSILPDSSQNIEKKSADTVNESKHTDEEIVLDENHNNGAEESGALPRVVNENAAIGKKELRLISTLAEQINLAIQHNKSPSPERSNKLTSLKNKHILSERYGKCIGMIGQGAYGTVWVTARPMPEGASEKLAYNDTYEHNGKYYYAIKELKPRTDESQDKFCTRLTSEFVIGHSLSARSINSDMGKSFSHPNILKVLDIMQTNNSFIEVFEFCPSGDLYTLLTRTSKSGSGLHPLEADCFMKQLLNGVAFMHSHGVAHCDLKPENILFTPSGVLKICDFGSSSVFQTAWEKRVHFQTGAVGSEPYVAPEEFIPKAEYDTRLVDCWGCGIIYCTMILGHYLWKVAIKEKDQVYNTFVEYMTERGEYYVFEQLRHVNQELNRCRKMCLYNVFQWNPKKRITVPKLLETPWMKKTKCCINYMPY